MKGGLWVLSHEWLIDFRIGGLNVAPWRSPNWWLSRNIGSSWDFCARKAREDCEVSWWQIISVLAQLFRGLNQFSKKKIQIKLLEHGHLITFLPIHRRPKIQQIHSDHTFDPKNVIHTQFWGFPSTPQTLAKIIQWVFEPDLCCFGQITDNQILKFQCAPRFLIKFDSR